MVMLRPFRALRYNADVIGDLSAVVAPPYDVISAAHREALHQRDPHNVIRLILNRDADPYGSAGQLLKTWRQERVLVREHRPALCFYVEDFLLPSGEQRRREGIIGVVRLEPFTSGHIRPHERTLARAKEDRMRLLRACRTNLSPLFGLFADRLHVLDPAKEVADQRAPDIDIRDDAKVRHRLWLIADPAVIAAICGPLTEESVVIADGHHRYETALAYAEQRRAQGDHDPAAAQNFVMMYVTSMEHPGLVILPTHRVLSGAVHIDVPQFLRELERRFRLTCFPRGAQAQFRAALREPPRQARFGVVLAGHDELLLATAEDPAVADAYVGHLDPVVRRLDVTILDSVILRGLIGIDCTAAAQDGRLTYTHDDEGAMSAVANGAQAAFLMNPPDIADVEAACLAGQTMPEKSTYFYPKLLTGLVFHPFDD